MAVMVYNIAKRRFAEKYMGGDNNPVSFGALLLRSTASGATNPDLNYVSELLGINGVAEVSGGLYARQPLSNIRVVFDNALDRVNVKADPLTFGAVSGATAIALVIYEEGSSDGGRRLVSYHSLPAPTPLDTGVTISVSPFLRIR